MGDPIIPEDLREDYSTARNALVYHEHDHRGTELRRVIELVERIARSEQALAALEARNKKAEALLLRWNKAAGWYCAGSEFVDDPERVFESIKSRMEMREKLGQRKAETAARAAQERGPDQ